MEGITITVKGNTEYYKKNKDRNTNKEGTQVGSCPPFFLAMQLISVEEGAVVFDAHPPTRTRHAKCGREEIRNFWRHSRLRSVATVKALALGLLELRI
jgi:hypothetical protein